MSKLLSHNKNSYHLCSQCGTVIAGSGKTLAFGIPMIHTILEWKKGSDELDDDNSEPATKVESLYLPTLKSENAAECETEEDKEDNVEVEEEEVEDQDQGYSDEDASEDDEHSGEEIDEDEKLGCVRVIENAGLEFDPTAETEEKPAGGQSQPLLGLVLTPTRELAVQVKHHIDAVAKFTGKSFNQVF